MFIALLFHSKRFLRSSGCRVGLYLSLKLLLILLATALCSLLALPLNGEAEPFTGTVGFSAGLKTGGSAIFTGNGGPLTTIALGQPSQPPTFGTFIDTQQPSINNQGTVAFTAMDLQTTITSIFTGSGGPLNTIIDNSGSFQFVSNPSINNKGLVAFEGGLKSGFEGIFVTDGTMLRNVADTSRGFGFLYSPAISNVDLVAFFASTQQYRFVKGTGIFTGPDPIADRVIGTNNALFVSTVTDLWGFAAQGFLNDARQIPSVASLSNGNQGIFRADPVPKPTTLLLFGLLLLGSGLIGLWGLRRRSLKSKSINKI